MSKIKTTKMIERGLLLGLSISLGISLNTNKAKNGTIKELKKECEVIERELNNEREVNKDLIYEISELKLEHDYELQNNNNTVKKLKNDLDGLKKSKLIEVGEFEITNYTLDPKECGKPVGHEGYGITASGKKATEGTTVAADWSVLPKGTKIYIDGVGIREVQDTGNLVKGNIIDVFVGDPKKDRNAPSRAKTFGRQKRKVWIIEDENK